MLYYAVFILLTITATLEFVFKERKQKVLIYGIIILMFILMSGLRWNTGNDWKAYKYLLDYGLDRYTNRQLPFESGFLLLMRFVNQFFFGSFTAYLLIFAFLNIGIKGIFFYKETNAILIALLLFWGTQVLAEITGVRQSLAISICICSLYFIERRKIIPFVFTVLLACSIHASSFIFLFAYPIFHAKWSVKSKSIWTLVLIFLAVLGSANLFLKFVMTILPDLGYLTAKAEEYEKLGSGQTYNAGVNKFAQLAIGIFKRITILPIIFYYEATLLKNNKRFASLSNLFVFGNLVYFLIADFLSLQRLATFFYIYEVVLLCIIFQNSRKKPVWFVIIVLYSFLKLVFTLKSAPTLNGVNLLDPYLWIFSENSYRKMF